MGVSQRGVGGREGQQLQQRFGNKIITSSPLLSSSSSPSSLSSSSSSSSSFSSSSFSSSTLRWFSSSAPKMEEG